jgi:hypothetical protein
MEQGLGKLFVEILDGAGDVDVGDGEQDGTSRASSLNMRMNPSG